MNFKSVRGRYSANLHVTLSLLDASGREICLLMQQIVLLSLPFLPDERFNSVWRERRRGSGEGRGNW